MIPGLDLVPLIACAAKTTMPGDWSLILWVPGGRSWWVA